MLLKTGALAALAVLVVVVVIAASITSLAGALVTATPSANTPGEPNGPATSPPTSEVDGPCIPTGESTNGLAGYQADQLANATTIVEVGKRLNIPQQGWVVAIAAALQESGLRNLNHGDRDSLGLFQQRPSQGWGTPTQVMHPTYAATQFYRHLLALPGWQQMSVNNAAQAVQRSATPNAYGRHEQAARALVHATQTAACSAPRPDTTPNNQTCARTPASPAARAVITYACAQLGKPYVWGGNGQPGFDCSGLTTAAYQAAGITLPRTAHTQYQAGPLLPAGTPLAPGDLIFFGTPQHVHHVAISLGGTTILHAPTYGQPVQISDYRTSSKPLAASRPTTQGNT